MSFQHFPGVGMVHLQTVKPARVVPGSERHRWDGKPKWGESTKCTKCGCVKHRLKIQPDYTERYQLAGTTAMLSERPACTGSPVCNCSFAMIMRGKDGKPYCGQCRLLVDE